MNPLKTMFNLSTNIYNSLELADQMDDIYKSLADVYSDIADADIKTAKEVLLAASNTEHPEIKINCMINSLISAYNIYIKLIGKNRKDRFLIFTYQTPYISNEENFYREITRICTFICWGYRSLKEETNAGPWQKKAMSNYKKYIDRYTPSCTELQKINDNYIYEKTTEEEKSRSYCGDGMPDYVQYEMVTRQYFTDEGYEYIKKRKIDLINEFPNFLRSKTIDFNFQPKNIME